MEKIAIVWACVAFACHGRRVQTNLAPNAVRPPRVPTHVHSRSPPVVAQWWDTGSAAFGPATVSGPRSDWDLNAISPDGRLVKRIEGQTRKTWSFNDISKDRVSVAVGSEGRPVHVNIDLWIGPDWTPFKLKAYSLDGRLRPIQTLVGTRNKPANIDIVNAGSYEFPLKAAANYAEPAMAEVVQRPKGELCQGSAIRSYVIDPSTKQLEVCLRTDGKQLNAKIELLNSPNNPKQTYEVFTNNGELNSLCVSFNTPDVGTTMRVHNLASVEFPCYVNLKEISDEMTTEMRAIEEEVDFVAEDVPGPDEVDAEMRAFEEKMASLAEDIPGPDAEEQYIAPELMENDFEEEEGDEDIA